MRLIDADALIALVMDTGVLMPEFKQTFIALVEGEPTIDDLSDRYEYHYDHTDCIWYRPEAKNRCPVTCAQYRDGWNDAMNYIFRDGKGYRPYRRNDSYGE